MKDEKAKSEDDLLRDFEKLANKFMECLQEMGFKKISKAHEHGELVNDYGYTVFIDYGRGLFIGEERKITISGKTYDPVENKVRDAEFTLYFDAPSYFKEQHDELMKKLLTPPPKGSERLWIGGTRYECMKCGCLEFIKKDGKHVCCKCGEVVKPPHPIEPAV